MNTGNEPAGLRQLLNALEHEGMTIHLNGKDVTKQEADKLRPDIEYLEKALARTRYLERLVKQRAILIKYLEKSLARTGGGNA